MSESQDTKLVRFANKLTVKGREGERDTHTRGKEKRNTEILERIMGRGFEGISRGVWGVDLLRW